VLDEGARRAEAAARETMAQIYPAMGLIARADRVN
jgi:hypothetical protein